MAKVKDIELRVIPASLANPFVKRHHYSGKVVSNSQLHFGAFLNGQLHGVMSFGLSTDKKKILPLVAGTSWDGMLELNRMAFDDILPRNSESYCISKAIKLIKKYAPQVKWIISYADGCSCGDGTIYRASNFILTQIKPNTDLYELSSGEKIHQITLTAHKSTPRKELRGLTYNDIGCDWKTYCKITGAKPLDGFMLRYIYFIDPKWRKRLTVPELPYSAIQEAGAGMYLGKKKTNDDLNKK